MHHEDRKIALQNARVGLRALERLAGACVRCATGSSSSGSSTSSGAAWRRSRPSNATSASSRPNAEFLQKLEAVQAAAFEQIRRALRREHRLRLTAARPMPSSAVLTFPVKK